MFVTPGQPSTGGDVNDQSSGASTVLPLLLLEQGAAIQDAVQVDLNWTVKKEEEEESLLTFLQRSNPSIGLTPALLTRMSILDLKNFSATAQTLCHWSLSVTSCSSNMQEDSPNL